MVCILLGSGFEEAEALVPADLLRRARLEVCLAGVDGMAVTGAHGITVRADRSVEEIDADEVELLFLPGGLGGVEAMRSSAPAVELIRRCRAAGKWVAAICAAPTLLAGLGLLDGVRAVCYPGLEDQLTGAVPCPGTPVVQDGRVITGEAAGSAFPFGLKLIEALRGPETAAKIGRSVHHHG